MPCYTINEIRLELINANLELLKKAIESQCGNVNVKTYDNGLAWNGGSYNQTTGNLTVRNSEVGNRIKKAYSAELVQAQAKRFGWQTKKIDEFKYEITKR